MMMELFLILCAIFIFFSPLLAFKIKNRFSELGYEMKSNPLAAMLNVSSFWREAKEVNQKYNDELIKRYIFLWRTFWFFAILVVVIIFLSDQ